MKMDLKTGGFESFGEYLKSVRNASLGRSKDGRLDDIEGLWLDLRKTAGHMEESVDSQGGFLVPEEWASGIYHAAMEGAIVRPRATVFPMVSDSLKVNAFVETTRNTSLFGGITFTWTAERGQKATAITKPAIGQKELTPHKLVGGCYASNELEDDYGAFAEFMRIAFGTAIRFIEDDYFLWGNGAGQPLGAIAAGNAACLQVTRNAIGALDWTDISNMTERLLPDSWNRAVWIISPSTLGELLDANAAAANVAVILDASNMTILTRPVIVSEKLQAMGTRGDIALCDFGAGHYLIGDREMRILASRETGYGDKGFITDETFWKVVLRIDGQPLMTAGLTPYRDTTATVSPFVVLTTTS